VVGFRFLKRVEKQSENGMFSERLVTVLDEPYRILRINLLRAVADAPLKVILVTSPGPAEGKSTTCANLGAVLAQAHKNTLIMDGDLRKPSMHKFFGVDNLFGVVDVLSGELNLSEVWEEPLPKLKMLSSGPLLPDSAQLLDSERFAELVYLARQQFDCVLVDSPAMGSVFDPMIIAAHVDAVLLVLDSKTRKESLRNAVRGLEAVGANILGTVINNVEKAKSSHHVNNYSA
jgi:capsular exopolysaccharide synthesis family protein